MYDLTSVLTTIAACSASLVAILGGFIASRLISLNAERSEAQTRLSEVNDEIAFYEKERDHLQAELDEDDALDFIKENINSVIEESPLEKVYKEESRPRIEKAVLAPYWERACNVWKTIYTDIDGRSDDDDYAENEDGVPITVAKKMSDDFEYETCRKIMKSLDSSTNRFANILTAELPDVSGGYWYAKAQQDVSAFQNKIDWSKLQKLQITARHKALQKPKGMAMGLVLFSVFSVANIIAPLVLSPLSTNNYYLYNSVKIGAIVSFAIGLAAILLYLVYLLHWSGKKES